MMINTMTAELRMRTNMDSFTTRRIIRSARDLTTVAADILVIAMRTGMATSTQRIES